MSLFLGIAALLLVLELGNSLGHLLRAQAKRIKAQTPEEIAALRAEIAALSERVDGAERTALDSEEKVRFLEKLLTEGSSRSLRTGQEPPASG